MGGTQAGALAPVPPLCYSDATSVSLCCFVLLMDECLLSLYSFTVVPAFQWIPRDFLYKLIISRFQHVVWVAL